MDTLKTLQKDLEHLKLDYLCENCEVAAGKAARAGLSHLEFLAQLIAAQRDRLDERATKRRIRNARLPFVRTLDTFDWTFPTTINRSQIQNLFHLRFLDEPGNVVFLGETGVGKTHLAIALAHHACINGHRGLYTTAIDIVNHLLAARQANCFAAELRKFLRPPLLLIDELGYLPIDQQGADCLFQVVSQRYERASTILTTNRKFKHWGKTFNNDNVLTSALLDRLLHRAEVVVIEGPSYRQTHYR
ncbi:MAG: IS21-like element helper ATPase IstB [Lentisphaeria bacterium]|nr:IS21-like element helper ATPase IstB [Lentisphaeria bacterium]